jgi:hypothetical protein
MKPKVPIVISVPAGKTIDLIAKHGIYSCPDMDPWRFEEEGLIAFPDRHGCMDEYYHIARLVILNPQDVECSFNISEELRGRIAAYLLEARPRGVIEQPGNYRFYFVEHPVALALGKSVEGSPLGWVAVSLKQLEAKALMVSPVENCFHEKVPPNTQAARETKDIMWYGVTHIIEGQEKYVSYRNELADTAKEQRWPRFFELLRKNQSLINCTRLGGQSLFTPLHHAAYGGASVEVIQQLIDAGA